MAKNFAAAALMGAALVFGTAGMATQAFAAVEVSEADQAAFDTMQAAIEQLIVDNAGDEAALEAAIEAYVEGADNPELAAKASIEAATNPKSAAAKAAIQNNPGLAAAAGRGLGAAIATISVTNPEVATNMQASVTNSGSPSFASAVQSGNVTKTSSIQQASKSSSSTSSDNQTGNTPENSASGT
ncbi:MAG: hypothetical protein GC184_03815 [Rhizobiales bacterium]|nr:hypothetical protein [Hyphomicrobiales bacterium]